MASNWLRKNIKELFAREGYKVIEDENELVFLKEGYKSVYINLNHGWFILYEIKIEDLYSTVYKYL